MAKNIVKWSNLQDQLSGQPITLMISFTSGLLLDPVLTGPTGTVWTWPDGSTTSTGNTPSPTLTNPGRYVVTMDDQSALTAIDVSDDAVKQIQINSQMTGLAMLTAPNNPSLLVDDIVDQIYALREILPAMTVNIGGTCPFVSAASNMKIQELISAYGHTWTYNVTGFLFTVKTDNTGPSNNDQFTIPLFTGETYNFTVYYDGQQTTHTSDSDLTLTFPSGAGTYGVTIVGVFPRIYFNNTGDKLKLTGITQFGNVSWGTTFDYAFYGCANCVSTVPALPSNMLRGWFCFESCGVTGQVPDWPPNITTIRRFYRLCTGITGNVPVLPATVDNMENTYAFCSGLTGTIGDQSAADGTLTNVIAAFRDTGLTGNSEDFWNWTTPPTSTANCYLNATSLTDYKQIPTAYGGLGEPVAADGAYSVARRIFSTYAGSIIRVREDGGGTEADIGVDGNGDLDTAALATHCGANNGFVKTVYDQSGNGYDMSQTNTTYQAKIYDSVTGTVTVNGKPAMHTVNNNNQRYAATGSTFSQPNTFFHVVQQDAAGTGNDALQDGTTNRNIIVKVTLNWRLFAGSFSANASTSPLAGNQGIIYGLFNAASSEYRHNDDAVITGLDPSTGSFGPTWYWTGYNASNPWQGYVQEFLIYNSDQSAKQPTISYNLNAYYSVY